MDALVTNPTELAWWWEYGLDGVVGAAAAALVAWWAVRHTIRQERRSHALAEARAAVAELQALAVRKTFETARVSPEPRSRSTDLEWVLELYTQVVKTIGASVWPARELATDLVTYNRRLRTLIDGGSEDPEAWSLDDDRAGLIASALVGVLANWQFDPEKYPEVSPVDWDHEIAEPEEQ